MELSHCPRMHMFVELIKILIGKRPYVTIVLQGFFKMFDELLSCMNDKVIVTINLNSSNRLRLLHNTHSSTGLYVCVKTTFGLLI